MHINKDSSQAQKSLQKSIARRQLNFQEKPLKGVRFYLDIKAEELRQKVCVRLRELGGRVEEFLSKDVDTFLTDAQQKTQQHPHGNSLSNITSHSSQSGRPSPALSRGQALLLKATQQVESSSVTCTPDAVQNAHNLGVKVQQAKEFLKSTAKIAQRCRQAKIRSMPEEPLDGVSPLKWHKQEINNKIVLKFEDVTQNFRPVLRHLECFPQVRYDEGLLSPFDKGVILCRNGDRNSNRYSAKKKTERGASKGGFCEACDYWYKCSLREHLNSEKHQKFVRNSHNYDSLDKVVNLLPNIADFVSRYIPTTIIDFPKSDSGFGDATSETDMCRESVDAGNDSISPDWHNSHSTGDKHQRELKKKDTSVSCEEAECNKVKCTVSKLSVTLPYPELPPTDEKTPAEGCVNGEVTAVSSQGKDGEVLDDVTNTVIHRHSKKGHSILRTGNHGDGKDISLSGGNTGTNTVTVDDSESSRESCHASKSVVSGTQFHVSSPTTSPKSHAAKDKSFARLATMWMKDIANKENQSHVPLASSQPDKGILCPGGSSSSRSAKSIDIEERINRLARNVYDSSEMDEVVNYSAKEEQVSTPQKTVGTLQERGIKVVVGSCDAPKVLTNVSTKIVSTTKSRQKGKERKASKQSSRHKTKQIPTPALSLASDASVYKDSMTSDATLGPLFNHNRVPCPASPASSATRPAVPLLPSSMNCFLLNRKVSMGDHMGQGHASRHTVSSPVPWKGSQPSCHQSPRHNIEQFYQSVAQWQGIQSFGSPAQGGQSPRVSQNQFHLAAQNNIFPGNFGNQHPGSVQRHDLTACFSSPGQLNTMVYPHPYAGLQNIPLQMNAFSSHSDLNKCAPGLDGHLGHVTSHSDIHSQALRAQMNSESLQGQGHQRGMFSESQKENISFSNNTEALSRCTTPYSDNVSNQSGMASDTSEYSWQCVTPDPKEGTFAEHSYSSHAHDGNSEEDTDSYDYNSLPGMFLRQNQQPSVGNSNTPLNISHQQVDLDKTLTPEYLDISNNTKVKGKVMNRSFISEKSKLKHSISQILSHCETSTNKDQMNHDFHLNSQGQKLGQKDDSRRLTDSESYNNVKKDNCDVLRGDKSGAHSSGDPHHCLESKENIPPPKEVTLSTFESPHEDGIRDKVESHACEESCGKKEPEDDLDPLLVDDLLKDTPADKKKKSRTSSQGRKKESRGRGKKRKHVEGEEGDVQYTVQPLSATKIRLCRIVMTPAENKSSLKAYWKVQKSASSKKQTEHSGLKNKLENGGDRVEEEGEATQPKRKRRCMLDFSDKWIASFVF